jgi:hypothetical protein
MRVTAIGLIQQERSRQIYDEGWTTEHDDKHTDGELAEAASCYAAWAHSISFKPEDIYITKGKENLPKDALLLVERNHRWPWAKEWWKPTPDDRIKELVKAGALIVAEIERLQRKKDKDEKS